MDIPRLAAKNVAEELVGNAIKHAFLELGYSMATSNQEKAIRGFLKGSDVFISLPTGDGKCLCFAALPYYVFDYLRRHLSPGNQAPKHPSIAIVVSPLILLMKDQVAKFTERRLKCAYVGEEQTDSHVKSAVVVGDYQVVYLSPESLLCVHEWREMFRSTVYHDNLIALAVDEAHCVEKWCLIFTTKID